MQRQAVQCGWWMNGPLLQLITLFLGAPADVYAADGFACSLPPLAAHCTTHYKLLLGDDQLQHSDKAWDVQLVNGRLWQEKEPFPNENKACAQVL